MTLSKAEWVALFLLVVVITVVADFAIVNQWWSIVGTIVFTLGLAAASLWWQGRARNARA